MVRAPVQCERTADRSAESRMKLHITVTARMAPHIEAQGSCKQYWPDVLPSGLPAVLAALGEHVRDTAYVFESGGCIEVVIQRAAERVEGI